MTHKNLNIVALGGGTGLPLLLRACVALDQRPQAIVTMADDGGSSGRLRKEVGIVPPGDVRNCLAALASPEEALLGEMMGYRFSAGEGLEGHALGNLIMAALTDMSGGFEQAVKVLERHLRIQGRVLPSTFENIVLHGLDRSGRAITGQESLATSSIAINEVYVTPDEPSANPEALEAIAKADLIIVSPGSLFTSIIPNLLVAGIAPAICTSTARVVYFCNVANMRGETTGFGALDHVEALQQHGLGGRIDAVVLDRNGLDGACEQTATQLKAQGIEPLIFDLVSEENPNRHDVDKLRVALEAVM